MHLLVIIKFIFIIYILNISNISSNNVIDTITSNDDMFTDFPIPSYYSIRTLILSQGNNYFIGHKECDLQWSYYNGTNKQSYYITDINNNVTDIFKDRITIAYRQNMWGLIISDIKVTDYGIYRCNASNEFMYTQIFVHNNC